jgi:phytanoyl-CoA hydroxylase
MSPTGILKPGTSPRNGIFNDALNPLDYQGIGGAPTNDTPQKLLSAHTTPEYLSFLRHPALRTFVRRLMAWDHDLLLARTMLRHNVPNSQSTGIHYDKIFLRGGEADFLTAWVPIGDCAANGGGLLYLEDSTLLGKAIEADFSERANEFTPEEKISAFNRNMTSTGTLAQDAVAFGREERTGNRWLTANFGAGDVVFHNPYLVHGAGKNEDPEGRIRLSTDLRFYEEGIEGMDERWMKVWSPDDGL